jgi:hypothetical protein
VIWISEEITVTNLQNIFLQAVFSIDTSAHCITSAILVDSCWLDVEMRMASWSDCGLQRDTWFFPDWEEREGVCLRNVQCFSESSPLLPRDMSIYNNHHKVKAFFSICWLTLDSSWSVELQLWGRPCSNSCAFVDCWIRWHSLSGCWLWWRLERGLLPTVACVLSE